ncbi:hypothetical protein T484DRAFT_1774101 [Baffinella frigidus]|nr:hypothetical protein T484DRAFT_1774101 [Cryptophyta sp. CCMP2293]
MAVKRVGSFEPDPVLRDPRWVHHKNSERSVPAKKVEEDAPPAKTKRGNSTQEANKIPRVSAEEAEQEGVALKEHEQREEIRAEFTQEHEQREEIRAEFTQWADETARGPGLMSLLFSLCMCSTGALRQSALDTALWSAAAVGDVDRIKALVEEGADVQSESIDVSDSPQAFYYDLYGFTFYKGFYPYGNF